MEPHPYCLLFPEMEPIPFGALKRDIEEHGQHEPVILHEGKILDGRHRWKACQELGMECQTSEFKGRDALAFATGANLHRRHLSDSQRAMIAARLANLQLGSNQHREGSSIEEPSVTRVQAAKILDVSPASVDRARAVIRKGAPELIKKVDSGKITVGAAERLAKLSHARQVAVLADGEEVTMQAVRESRQGMPVNIEPLESPPPAAPKPKRITYRPEYGMELADKAIRTLERITEDDSQFREGHQKVLEHCQKEIARCTKPGRASDYAAHHWLQAQAILDKILPNDTDRDSVLRAVIQYAQDRISAGQ